MKLKEGMKQVPEKQYFETVLCSGDKIQTNRTGLSGLTADT